MKAYHEAISDIIPDGIRKLFFQRTLDVIATGRNFYSATTIMQHIRFHTDITINDPDAHYKINNNWTPVLSREFMAAFPEHGNFFRTRNQARVPQAFYSGDFEELSQITPVDPKQAPFPLIDFETRSTAPLPNCYEHPPKIDPVVEPKKPVSNANRLARSFCADLAS